MARELDAKSDYVAIIGAGSWGTTIAKVIADNKPNIAIKLWAYERSVVKAINDLRENKLYQPGIKLPENILPTNNLRDAVSASNIIILATPSRVLHDISLKISRYIPDEVYIGYLTKGFCKVHNEILTISEALSETLPVDEKRIVAIYGPSHSEEVIKGYHTCLNIGGISRESCKLFVDLLSCDYLECRIADDIRGVELGGTLKNPAAIAAGMISVLPNCGDNLIGALISESFKEILRIGKSFNVREETLLDVSGLGDLITTALSDHSRNRRFGKDIAKQILSKGKTVNLYDRILMRFKPESVFEKMSERMHYLAEGAYAIEPLIEIAAKKNISIPVYQALYEILLNKKSPGLLIETVKNPDKFEELYLKAKVQVTKRKKGMEKTKASIFKNIIINDVVEKFNHDPELTEQLFDYRDLFLDHIEKERPRKAKARHNKSRNNEIRLFKGISRENSARVLKDISKLYLDNFLDRFNTFSFKLYYTIIKLINLPNLLFKRNYHKGLFRDNIRIRGDFDTIRKISDTSNLVYIPTYRSYFDFLFINVALSRLSLHAPRFFVNDIVVHSFFQELMIKLSGGYIIDVYKFINPIYREVIRSYLSTLVQHGIPVLFFPEIYISKDGNIRNINKEFVSSLMESLYKNNEEIALIPIELSYYKKPFGLNIDEDLEDISLRKIILSNVVEINFSKPILVSEFSSMDKSISYLTNLIDVCWKSDSFIFPHYIFCKILRENNYTLEMDNIKKTVKRCLQELEIKSKYRPANIVKFGVEFIRKNRIGEIKGNKITVSQREEVDYYANLIY